MVIPWVVVGVLWVVGCALFAYDALYTQQIAASVRQMSLPAVSALDQVQRERLRSLEVVSQPGLGSAELIAQQRRTDQALAEMNATVGPLIESAPEEVRRPMADLTGYLNRLNDMRSRVAAGQVSVGEINQFFDGLFDAATQLFDVQSRITLNPETLQGALVATETFRASDMFSREASLVGAALAAGQMTPDQHRQVVHYIEAQRTTLQHNAPNLVPSVRQQYELMLASPSWQQLVAVENTIISNGSFDRSDPLPVQLEDWRRITNDVVSNMSGLVSAQADEVSANGVRSGNDALWTVVWGSLVALAVAVVSFIFARRVYRTVVDEALLTRLQGLRTESLAMAQKLPDVVRRLREGETVDVKSEMVALEHYGDDEVGEVAQAIRVFQQEAVEAAVGETRARQGARVVFVGMAHRIQRLLRHMHGTIDQLEKNEENSSQLAKLFELDNSTTRARRTVENLLVLGDQQPGRRWSRPVPLMDVLRSSISEIDQYSRVVIGHVPEVMVNGSAVGDTIHLISELIDNATAFSPPNTQVHVDATAVARGVAIDIADQGLGMDQATRDRANAMMSEPPEFDRLVLENNKAEQLGLFTAARLAHRRDISVEFGVSAYGGTRATVLLPDRILEHDTAATTSNGAGSRAGKTGATPASSGGKHQLEEPTVVPRPRELSWNGVMTDQPTPPAPKPVETTYEWPMAEPNPGSQTAQFEPVPRPDPTPAPSPTPPSARRRPSSGRPPLPKRVPQTHLAEGLRDDPEQEEQAVVASPSRLAGFRRAFRGGFGDEPNRS
ncbi:histidine kinase [Saccharopolyspora subtropica]|uniref:histidine kinase n=1 Tax=Saccharopolyspora thermophila TaxID=89367 RepID=A0A917NDS2_9PSEU|nr:ATP-binding protein [Saccharopolyspora subtropica]GGI87976.1 histidine kinase [Saccharopolyspora subtropica]